MTTHSEFSDFSKAMVEFIISYNANIRDRKVVPDVKPGYLEKLIPSEAPVKAEEWPAVMKDIERVIMPGMTHWAHPNFFAFYPAAMSYPATVADMLAGTLGTNGFSWASSPASTELEMNVMNWLGKMLNLPEDFLFAPSSRGGGCIQGTASETTLMTMLAARARAVKRFQVQNPTESDPNSVIPRLVAYGSVIAHCSVEKAAKMGGVKLRLLEVDENNSVRGATLKKAMKDDIKMGLVPFYVAATLGTTICCSYDNILELGPLCQSEAIWMHIDAAYAGAAFICPEYRHLLNGVEMADSFNFNPHKWLLVNFDCSALWVRDQFEVVSSFNVNALYLQHEYQGEIPDFRDWPIPFGRRFRSLKIWFVMRLYGQDGLRAHIRKGVALAKKFEAMVLADERFEIVVPVQMGLVCFRLNGPNSINERLNKSLYTEGQVYLCPSTLGDTYFMRMAIGSVLAEETDIQFAWEAICKQATDLLKAQSK